MLKTKPSLMNLLRSSRRLQEQYISKKPLSTRVAAVLGKLRSPEMVRLSNQILLFGRNDIVQTAEPCCVLASYLDPGSVRTRYEFQGIDRRGPIHNWPSCGPCRS